MFRVGQKVAAIGKWRDYEWQVPKNGEVFTVSATWIADTEEGLMPAIQLLELPFMGTKKLLPGYPARHFRPVTDTTVFTAMLNKTPTPTVNA